MEEVMELENLIIVNFMAYRGEVEVELARRGLILLEGRNGAGKSTIAEAIIWCLTGKTLRGLEGDAVVNRIVGKNCRVALDFRIKGRQYRVARHRLHEDHKNRLIVYGGLEGTYLDDEYEDLTQGTNQATQERLDKLLGVSFDTLVACLVFAQGARFRFAALTDREQKAILDEVLGTEQYARAGKLASAELSTCCGQLSTAQGRLDAISESLKEAYEEAKAVKRNAEGFAESKTKKVLEWREKLEKAGKLVKELEAEDPELPETLAAAVKKAEEEVDALRDKHDEYHRCYAEWHRDLNALGAKIEKAKKEVERKKTIGAECPTCGRDVDKKLKKSLVRELEMDIEHDLEKHAGLRRETDDWLARKNDATVAIAEKRKLVQQLVKDQADARERRSRLKQARVTLESIAEQLKEAEDLVNPYHEMLKKLNGRCATYHDQIGELQAQVDRLTRTESALAFWSEGFSARGLRSLLMDAALPVLNAAAAKYSAELFDDEVTVEFRTQSELKSGEQRDRFEVAVDHGEGAETYTGLSSGERARVDLCVGMALQELVASRARTRFNIAFFDEPVESVDAAAHERVVELLAALKLDSVFVMTHSSELGAFFPNAMTVSRGEDGGSVVA